MARSCSKGTGVLGQDIAQRGNCVAPIIGRDMPPGRCGKRRKRSSRAFVLAVILVVILLVSVTIWLVVHMGSTEAPLPSRSAGTNFSRLAGSAFSGSGGHVVTSPPVVYLGFWPGGIVPGTEGWASWYFSVDPAPPTYALTISFLYTDTSMGGGGPSIYIYNHDTLFWDLVASKVGHGTNVQKSYSVSTNYITSTGGVNVKISNSYGAKITWVEVAWSYQDIPEFGMMPLVVMGLMVVIALAVKTKRKKSRGGTVREEGVIEHG